LQIAHDPKDAGEAESERLQELSRRTSGMISNFIAHLQGSDYRGEKTARPQRQAGESREKQREALRAAQLVNMQSAANRNLSPPPPDQ
jgi:hypothetical protein